MRRVMVALLITTSLLTAIAASASADEPCYFGCISIDSVTGPTE